MRVERGQHAVDGRFDQLLVGHLLDILPAYPLEHFAEQVERPLIHRRLRAAVDGGALVDELAAAWIGALEVEAGGWASAGMGARSASDTANSAGALVADFWSFMRARSSGGHEPISEC